MKYRIKTLIMVVASVSTVFLSDVSIVEASAGQRIGLYLNESEVKNNDNPFIKNGVTYIPVRVVGDLIGVKTEFDNSSKTVTISNDDVKAIFEVGNKMYSVNGREYVSNAEPLMISERIYVPLRVVGEVFGAKVSIDSKTQSIIIDFKEKNYNKLISDKDFISNLGIVQADSRVLFSELLNSKEFDELSTAVINSQEFKNKVTSVFNGEDFKSLLNEVLNTPEYGELIEELKSQPEYDVYLEDIKNMDSYSVLLDEYGEGALLCPLLNKNLKVEECVNLFSNLLNDKNYLNFLNECKDLDSYDAYRITMFKIINNPRYATLVKKIKTSDNFNLVYKELSKIFSETIKVLPETEGVLKLYDEGAKRILSKNAQK